MTRIERVLQMKQQVAELEARAKDAEERCGDSDLAASLRRQASVIERRMDDVARSR